MRGFILSTIAIIGSNIFAPGGTTRSNLNLLKEFSNSGYQLKYFNEAEYINQDVKRIRKIEGLSDSIQFLPFQKLEDPMDIEVYIITRESLFKIAKILKQVNPTSKIIGELHGPISLIKEDITDSLPYFDSIRVATESIKELFIKKYNFNRVFVQTVSLYHLEALKKIVSQKTNNLLIYSRFDEEAKDISYAIKLIAHIVNDLGFHQIRLYINGYGEGEILYKSLIKKYGISQNVIINGKIPEQYIYVCTSKFETFGYSIVEAIWQGHRALLYCGDDNVLFENFKDYNTVCWLIKDMIIDGEKVVQLLKSEPETFTFEHDLQLISKKLINYVPRFMDNISQFNAPDCNVQVSEQEIQGILKKSSSKRIIKKIYLYMRYVPLIGSIVTSQGFKRTVTRFINR